MIDQITDGLFISDAASIIGSRGKKRMKELQIRRVLTASGMPIREEDRIPDVEYKFIFMMDIVSQDIISNGLLREAIKYIDDSVRHGLNVIVHCELGISRSVTLVAAYVMRHFQWSVDKAIMFVQKSRPIASPNLSFLQQLSLFEHLGYRLDPSALATSTLYRNYCADTGTVPTPVGGSAAKMLGAKIGGKSSGGGGDASHLRFLPRLAALQIHHHSNSSNHNPSHQRNLSITQSIDRWNNRQRHRRNYNTNFHPSALAATSLAEVEVEEEVEETTVTVNKVTSRQSSSPSSVFPSTCSGGDDRPAAAVVHTLNDCAQWATRRFRCRRCRTELFYDLHQMRHKRGGAKPVSHSRDGDANNDVSGNSTAVESRQQTGSGDDDRCTFEYLITPMKWMDLSDYQGKICCFKCKEKLGQYIWGGRICVGENDTTGKGCGAYVTPWVHIQKCKVDASSIVIKDNSHNSNMLVQPSQLPTVVISGSDAEHQTSPTRQLGDVSLSLNGS